MFNICSTSKVNCVFIKAKSIDLFTNRSVLILPLNRMLINFSKIIEITRIVILKIIFNETLILSIKNIKITKIKKTKILSSLMFNKSDDIKKMDKIETRIILKTGSLKAPLFKILYD